MRLSTAAGGIAAANFATGAKMHLNRLNCKTDAFWLKLS
jgi:hypothetical protein